MRNIKLLIEYDGTRYQGFTRRDSSKTISYKLQEALLRVTGKEVDLTGAVKTDPGVHATAQTVHFLTDTLLSLRELKTALNRNLPMDIAVTGISEMPSRFHAALNLKSCAYTYLLDTGHVPDIFTGKYALHFPAPLHTKAIEAAARQLCGTHDFACFSAGKNKKSTVRSISELVLYTSESSSQLHLYICADSFLRLMPQLIVGTLLDIGTGKRSPEDITAILEGTSKCSAPSPALGLCLMETNYV